MKKQQIICDETNHFSDEQDVSVYHVGNDKIRLFSTIETFVSEKVCIELSKIDTQFVLLPKYPVYQDGIYAGCATNWKSDDWISCFMGKGKNLRNSLEQMRKEVLYLASIGYDIRQMPYYFSYADGHNLVFDGTHRIQESKLSKEKLQSKNEEIFEGYVRSLFYSGMSEFTSEADLVYEYLSLEEDDLFSRVQSALDGEDIAAQLIKKDIRKKLKK